MAKPETVNFFGGLPTEPDVNRIVAETAGMQENQLIPYDLLERAIGEKRNSDRFRSVISALKKRLLRDRNWLLIAERNQGYVIADPSKRVGWSSSEVYASRRKILRASAIASTTDAAKLTEEQRRIRDHIRDIPAKLRLAELTAPKPIKAD
jgi:hypothetical protein